MTSSPFKEIATKAAAHSTAASLLLLTPGTSVARAEFDGKLQVTGPELLSIIKEDFLKRKYLVTGNLTQGVRCSAHAFGKRVAWQAHWKRNLPLPPSNSF